MTAPFPPVENISRTDPLRPIDIPKHGLQPGLRFCCLLDGRGGQHSLLWDDVHRWRSEDGPIWIHLERDHPMAQEWIRRFSGIEPVIGEALIAEESRPRVATVGEGLLIVLRGISRIQGETDTDLGGGLDFVPVHLWVDQTKVISLRDQDHQIGALRDVRDALAHGRGPVNTADVLVAIADKLVKDLEPYLDEQDAEIDRLEDQVLSGDPSAIRGRLAAVRRRAVHIRRYLVPQRDALKRLQNEEVPWISDRCRVHLREVLDKVLRMMEYLDAIRDSSTILHEDLSALISEKIARTSNRLAGVAALLLPPSLLAALLGMNVGGIPGSSHPLAFPIVALAVAIFTLVLLILLRRLRWL
jgi:zinc transporter